MSINSDSLDLYTSTLLDTLMSSEQERLNTFIRWPEDVPILPVAALNLAGAGFYVNREPNLRQTRCFSCGLVIDNWREGDVAMDRHRDARPDCVFVRAQDDTTGGIRVEEVDNSIGQIDDDGVIVGNHEELAEDLPRELYQFEEVRLQSFIRWPISDIVSPASLARAGFYSLNPNTNSASDSVQCAFCEGAVGSWERGDCPDREHRRHFPLCPFVLRTINPRLRRLEGRAENAGEIGRGLNVHVVNGEGMGNLQELGVHTHTAPRKPRFTSLSARLASFTGWPSHLIQTPTVLADAGFYYEHSATAANNASNGTLSSSSNSSTISDDHVRCFHCDGGLKHWDPDDDPWTEHARWFPQCSYVLLVKGTEFVAGAARGSGEPDGGRNRRQSTTTATATIPALPSTSSISPSVSSSTTATAASAITDRELQAHLQAAPALEALSLGIVVERVKQAIKEKLERTGSGFSNGAALIEAALNLQRDEDLDAEAASGRRGGGEGAEREVSNAFFQMLKNSMDEGIPVAQNQSDETEEPSEEPVENARSVPTTPRNLNAKDTRSSTNDHDHNMTVLNSAKSSTSATSNSQEEPSREQAAAAAAAVATTAVKLSLEEENRLLKEARLCKICMDSEVGIVFLPCGHLATCVQCAPNLQACPVCRSSIRATVRTFLS